MVRTFILVLVGVTSVGAFLIGTKALRLSASALRHAIGKTLEGIGLTLVFFAVNVGVAVIAILAARVVTRGFVSLYLADDETVLVLSLVQGLTFVWWREQSGASLRNSSVLSPVRPQSKV